MLDDLNSEDRLRLMKFICSFAWADLHIQDSERHFVRSMVARLGLSEEKRLSPSHGGAATRRYGGANGATFRNCASGD